MPPSPKAARFRTALVRPNARKKPGREHRLAEPLLRHYEQGLPTSPADPARGRNLSGRQRIKCGRDEMELTEFRK